MSSRYIRHVEELADIVQLGEVFSARASLERERGHHGLAIELEERALRYVYQRPNVNRIAICHHNLGSHLMFGGPKIDITAAATHLLAATLLWHVTEHAAVDSAMEALSLVVPRPAGKVLPVNVEELAARAESVQGVRFGELFAKLLPDAEQRAELFRFVADHAERFYFSKDPELLARLRGGGAPSQRPSRKRRPKRRKR